MSVTAAKAGDIVNYPAQLVDPETGDNGTVAAACEEASGYWVCSTHKMSFQNNLQASIHEDTGKHLSYWWCHAHGPEAAT